MTAIATGSAPHTISDRNLPCPRQSTELLLDGVRPLIATRSYILRILLGYDAILQTPLLGRGVVWLGLRLSPSIPSFDRLTRERAVESVRLVRAVLHDRELAQTLAEHSPHLKPIFDGIERDPYLRLEISSECADRLRELTLLEPARI